MRQVLGTAEGSVKKLVNKESANSQENDKYDYKKDTPDELVYRDSSMFLKVSFNNISPNLNTHIFVLGYAVFKPT